MDDPPLQHYSCSQEDQIAKVRRQVGGFCFQDYHHDLEDLVWEADMRGAFHQNNTTDHRPTLAMAAIQGGFERVHHYPEIVWELSGHHLAY